MSGALLGGILLQLFTWIAVIFPHGLKIPGINLDVVDLEAKLGPGLAGISIGRNPEGVVTDVSEPLAGRAVRPRLVPEDRGSAPAPEPARGSSPRSPSVAGRGAPSAAGDRVPRCSTSPTSR